MRRTLQKKRHYCKLVLFALTESFIAMSEEETTPNPNHMDVDVAANESSSSPPAATSGVLLDIGIGSAYISGSDDEDINEPVTSKSSTPDSTTLASSVTRKPLTTTRHPLTKSSYFLFFLMEVVSIDRVYSSS